MKLHIWDFDSTMYHTPMSTMKEHWEKKTGKSWMGKGWWGNPDSLDMDIFDIALNQWVYNKYIKAEKGDLHYLVTGRLEKIKNCVERITIRDGLVFNEILCNPGNTNTLFFKKRVFKRLIREHKNVDEVIIYDDRKEHFLDFLEVMSSLKSELGIKITLIDSINKIEIKNERDIR